jgi:hypothetical protein
MVWLSRFRRRRRRRFFQEEEIAFWTLETISSIAGRRQDHTRSGV